MADFLRSYWILIALGIAIAITVWSIAQGSGRNARGSNTGASMQCQQEAAQKDDTVTPGHKDDDGQDYSGCCPNAPASGPKRLWQE